ncbi:imidazolonepropionase-like amidohydrolase [Cellulomonas hominis]|uniref:Imidazolonepropionase-like amidohydrolase n=1 Tax=Cellulomonas hominis TaxID=156981 RepID=A0A7W8WB68_9CELL|nr:hypothetical protein [Cellulomonas hominis]MBB5473463.1 imidazolonepropionase-like amidohydrolase [Cellulomonas hominis]
MTRPLVLTRARLLGDDAPVDLLLRDGRVQAVGAGAADAAGPAAERVDLDGRTVRPASGTSTRT